MLPPTSLPQFIFYVLLAYLLGSISFAVLISKLLHIADPRSYGSKNPGATNILRKGHKFAAALTLVGDAFKGWLALFLAQHYGANISEIGLAYIAIAAFLGHLYPIFLKFKGGKGVAIAAGILLAIHPVLGFATLLTWLIVAVFFKYSSFAALVSAVFAPFYAFFLFGKSPYLFSIIIISLMLIIKHRYNIINLKNGQENKIGQNI